MSKVKKTISKNIKKVKEEKKEEHKEKSQILTLAKIIFATLIFVILVTSLFYIATGKYTLKKDTTEIIYDEIISGQTFAKKDEQYYVVFYEYNSEEDLTETIADKISVIYKVDLTKKINQSIKSDLSNKDAQSSTELKISGPTLIKIEKNKNVDYIEGYDNIVNYLSEID